MLLLGLVSAVPVGPASLHLLLGPGVVVVLRELLDQSVELVGQLDTREKTENDSVKASLYT